MSAFDDLSRIQFRLGGALRAATRLLGPAVGPTSGGGHCRGGVGSALGGGLAWLAAPGPPDDEEVRALATSITGHQPDRIERSAVDAGPTAGPLVSLGPILSPQVKIVAHYPAGRQSQAISAAEVETMAEGLLRDGWSDVHADTAYGRFVAHVTA